MTSWTGGNILGKKIKDKQNERTLIVGLKKMHFRFIWNKTIHRRFLPSWQKNR